VLSEARKNDASGRLTARLLCEAGAGEHETTVLVDGAGAAGAVVRFYKSARHHWQLCCRVAENKTPLPMYVPVGAVPLQLYCNHGEGQ
jgi:hypothetical protein